jgi:hypothetical protein
VSQTSLDHAERVQKAITKLVTPKPKQKEVDFDKFVNDLIVAQTQKECPEEIPEYYMLNYVLNEPHLMLRLGDLRRKRIGKKKFIY